jgi:hypothetical protein
MGLHGLLQGIALYFFYNTRVLSENIKLYDIVI